MSSHITHTEVIDQAAFNELASKTPATMQVFGGKYIIRGGKVAPSIGDAPKRVIVSAFDSMEKAQAWRDSPGWKELSALRAKATKPSLEYIVEGVAQ